MVQASANDQTEHRLRALQELISALATVRTAREVAQTVAQLGCRAIGALTAMVWILEGDDLVLHGDVGAEPARVALWQRLAPSVAAPVWDAQRQRAPVYVETLAQFAQVAPHLLEHGRSLGPLRAFAALPLVAEGRSLGVVSFTFPLDHAFDGATRAYAHTLVAHCAQALSNAQLHERERRARCDAEAASRAKDEFLAMLGHELRNPLAPIVSALELMRAAQARGDSAEREIAVIERQVRHLQRLVDDLLDVSRIARGEVELRLDVVDVAGPIHSAVEVIAKVVADREQRLVLDLAPGLDVLGDPERLAQVVINLLVNATRYTPPGGSIDVRATAEGDHVVITVIDDGPGIAADLLPTVFEAFVQGPRARDRSEGGLGLGLAIVKNLVVQHGGEIQLARGTPRGTIARVTLPAARERPAAARPVPGVVPGVARALRVLIVDDNVDAAELLGDLVRLHGCEVEVAHDGAAALALAAAFGPELALLDIGLPEMNGYELAARLRAEPAHAALAIVALTGYAQPGDVARSVAAGFLDHLRKPLDADRLRALLGRVTAGRATA